MEVKKKTAIRSMQYDEFKNNDYLEQMVRDLNRDGAGIRRSDQLGPEQFAVVTYLRNELLRHRVYGSGSRTL